MTTQTASAETGSNGASVATGDTGTPAWDAILSGTGSAFTYTTTGGCKRGSLCYAFSVSTTSTTAGGEWNVNAGAAATAQWQRMYIDPADMSGAPVLARGMDSGGTNQRWRLVFSASTVVLRRADNTVTFTSSALSSGTRYRVEWEVAGSTTGACRLLVYVGESTTATYDSGASTDNFGGVIQRIRMGIGAGQTSVSGKCDDFGWSDTAALGPVAVSASPSSEGAWSIAAGAPVPSVGATPAEAAATFAAPDPTVTTASGASPTPAEGAWSIAASAPTVAVAAAPDAPAPAFAASAPTAAVASAAGGVALTFAASSPTVAAAAAAGVPAATFAAPDPTVTAVNAAGQPWLTAQLGPTARMEVDAAFGADLTDIDGSGWDWTDLSWDVRHTNRTTTTIARGDNVSQAGAAAFGFGLNNPDGNYTALNPLGQFFPNVAQNTPIRQRITLDGINWYTRWQGYADSWNPRATSASGRVRTVEVAAFGMLARLAGRTKPLRAPLYRAITTSTDLIAYWPLEDGAASTTAASFVATTGPLFATGAVKFAAATDLAGAATVPDLTGGTLTSRQLPLAAAGAWSVEFVLEHGTVPVADVTEITWRTSGTWGTWRLVHTSSGSAAFRTQLQFDGPGGTVELSSLLNLDVGWHAYQVTAEQVGANISVDFRVDGVSVQTDTETSATVGRPLQVALNPDAIADTTVPRISSVAVHSSVADYDRSGPVDGWAGETATDRLIRLCDEESVFLDLAGTSDILMGAQPVGAILALLRECEAADHGMLYDGFGPGISYQARTERYNADAALTLDMGATPPQVAPPFEPTFDKQATKNLYQVSRTNGSTVVVEQTDGPLGTGTIGVEDGQATVNLVDDTTLAAHGWWLVGLGTVYGYRFATLNLNLRAIPGKAAAVLAAGGPGYRITINRPSSKSVDLPPDPIDLFAEGWTETTTVDSWDLVPNCSPYQPNVVGVVGSTWRVDSASATLHTGVDAATTTLQVAATLPWVTDAVYPADFPFAAGLGGERVTVTHMAAPVAGVQAATVIRSVNGVVKAHDPGEPVSLWRPAVIAL